MLLLLNLLIKIKVNFVLLENKFNHNFRIPRNLEKNSYAAHIGSEHQQCSLKRA